MAVAQTAAPTDQPAVPGVPAAPSGVPGPQIAPSAPGVPPGGLLNPLFPSGLRPAVIAPTAPSSAPPTTTIPSVLSPGTALRRALPTLPPGVAFELHPTLTLSEDYTDNFFLTPDHRQEDFRSSLSPGAVVLINAARTKGSIGYTFTPAYDTATDDVSYFHAFDGRATWLATPRWSLTASDTLARTDDPRQGDRLGLRRGRSTFTSNDLLLMSDYRIANLPTEQHYYLSTFSDDNGASTVTHTAGISVSPTFYETNTATLGYEYITSHTGGVAESGHEVRASVARQATRYGWVGIASNYDWRMVTGDAENPGGDYTLWGVALFSSYGLPNKWSFDGSLGYSQVSPKQGPDESDITTQTVLSYRFARALATLTYEQGFSETFRQGQNFGVVKTQGLTGTLLYDVTPFITILTSALYRVDEIPQSIASEQPRETDKIWGVSLILSYRIRRWLTVELEYDHNDATSTDRDRAYRENRGRVTLSATF